MNISGTGKGIVAIALLGGVFALSLSCNNPTGPDDSIVFPDSNISYSEHIQPLFTIRCTRCHSGATPEAGLDLSTPSYSNLMNHVPRLVVSGQSNSSLLIQRLDGRLQPQMPLNSSPITQNQLNGIKKWIDEGALNN